MSSNFYSRSIIFYLTSVLFMLCGIASAGSYFIVSAADEAATMNAEIKKTEATAQTATDRINAAVLSKARVTAFSSNSQIGDAALRDFESLPLEIKKIQINGLFDKLDEVSTQLETDAKHLDDMRDEYCKESSGTFDAEVCASAKNKLTPRSAQLREKKKSVDDAKSDLLAALKGAYQTAQDFSGNFVKDLAVLTALAPDADGKEVLRVLPGELPNLANLIRFHKRMSDDWKNLSAPLLKLIGETSADQVNLNLTAADAAISVVKGKLVDWLKTTVKEAGKQFTERNQILTDVLKEPAKYGDLAAEESVNAENFTLALEQFLEICDGLKSLLNDPNFDDQVKALEAQKNQHFSLIARLQDGAVGDYKNFEGDYVPLYYFTDVPNLMRILNPQMQQIRDKLGLREIAEQKRRELDESTIILSNAQAEVSANQVTVRRLREQLDNAERAANTTFGLLEKAKKRLAGIGQDDTIKHQAAQQEVDNKSSENDAAQSTLKKYQDENNGLPIKIGNAEAALLAAQEAVRSKRTALVLLTQTESAAFAEARDSETVYFAPIVSTSRDPLKKVFIYSFGNRKIIYLRGTRDNINEAKKIIALLDRPAPQARMTLWTFELNGEATLNGTKKFNRSLQEIEKELSDTRLRISASLSFFRDAVNREVNRVAYETMRKYPPNSNNKPFLDRRKFQDLRWARLHFYQNEVLLRFGVDLKDLDNRYNQLYLSRIALPDPAGTATLGEALIVLTLANPVSRQNILDNFRGNVAQFLDEKLGVCPFCKEAREKCPDGDNCSGKRDKPEFFWFPATYRAMGGDLIREDSHSSLKNLKEKQLYDDDNNQFARKDAATPEFLPDFPDNLTAQQKEIVEALISTARPRILNRIRSRLNIYTDSAEGKNKAFDTGENIRKADANIAQINQPPDKNTKPEDMESDNSKKIKTAEQESRKDIFSETDSTVRNLSISQISQDTELLKFLLDWLWREADLQENDQVKIQLDEIKRQVKCNYDVSQLTKLTTVEKKELRCSDEPNWKNQESDKYKAGNYPILAGRIYGTAIQIKREIKFLENRFGREQSLNTANARVARVDLMLKQMIDAVDEDIDRHFVQPMMICLRDDLVHKKGIGVGIIDKTSILATNRLLARVDGRSSAELSIGEEQDVLQEVKQLTDVFLATKASGPFGALDSLSGLPNKDTSEIYGLTNGSLFKVTPIFDPTGQTLRFKFDYGTANLVQEPNGSINPQLPRIERHTVNTEVELNNMELREISRFNTNSRIGIPTKKTGGIPLIKDLPGMDKVPLLGWFTRRAGKDAVIQESLIFGQTTMYPTIGDLYELLHGSDYEDLEKEENQVDEDRKSNADAASQATPTPEDHH